MSAAAVVAYRWDGKRSQLFFQVKPDSYNTDSLIGFLDDLRRYFRRRKVILVWDGLPAHRSRAMTEYLRGQRRWLTVERLPGYAPELNPVEYLWGNVKGQELANLCADNLGHATIAFSTGMARVRQSQQLCFAFLRTAGLSF
jgi:DDE superfamily endonuclease